MQIPAWKQRCTDAQSLYHHVDSEMLLPSFEWTDVRNLARQSDQSAISSQHGWRAAASELLGSTRRLMKWPFRRQLDQVAEIDKLEMDPKLAYEQV